MGGLFNTLNVMGNTMMAQRAGANTASNNISNVNTPGYSRQRVMLESFAPGLGGVRATGVERAVDSFVDRRLDQQVAVAGFSSSFAQGAADIERVVGDLGEDGMSAQLDQFFAGFRELASAPSDPALRSQAIDRSRALASRINDAAAGLQSTQLELDARLPSHVARANQLIDDVATLNANIKELEASGGQAPELRDQRANAVSELAELVGAKGFEDDKGDFTVLVGGGISVVQGPATRPLALQTDPATGLQRVVTATGSRIDVTDLIRGGEVGGILELRDREIPGRAAQLDQFAFDLASAVNTVHNAGVGLDGATGRDLFAAPVAVAGAAAALTVDSIVDGNPDALGAAIDPTALPGDGRGAQALADMESQNVAAGGTRTLSSVLTTIIAEVGQSTAGATRNDGLQTSRLSALTGLREQISGVNMEEQMLALTQFQRAFQASARVVSTVDEMLQEVVNLT